MEILFAVAALVGLDVVALLWGADSRDSVDSREWKRMAEWRGFNSSRN